MPHLDNLNATDAAHQLQTCIGNTSLLKQRQAGRSRFSPSLSYGRHFGPAPSSAKSAAVMALLEPRETDGQTRWSIPLTVRPMHLPDHPGQVSLPGGRLEGDESFQSAAEREFCEELGTPTFPGKVIGEISPIYVYNSNYFVRVFVAVSPSQLTYQPCRHEVDEIVHLPLADLLDPSKSREQTFSRGGVSWSAPTLLTATAVIWGATAMMLGELKVLAEQPAV